MLKSVLPVLILLGLAASASSRTVSAIYFRAPQGAPEKVHVYLPEKPLVLDLPKMNLSDPVSLPGEDLVLRISARPLAKDQPVPEGTPSVSVPAAWSEVILLFAPNPKDTVNPFTVTALNASLDKFKPGEMLLFNRSNATVGGKLGNRSLKVGPGLSEKIEPPVSEDGDYPVVLGYALAGEKEAKPLANTTWRHQSDRRRILFVIPDQERGVPAIWSVVIYPPLKTASTP